MPKISEKKINKIKEEILFALFESSMKPLFTSQIAEKIIRDEEFTLRLLKELKKDGLVEEINKNPDGKQYSRRKRWLLKPKVYSAYKNLST
jgi:predicted transcriptional regulator